MLRDFKLSNYLWEILVPTIRSNGSFIRTRFHRVWDSKVREITGGLTILPPAKGHWVSPDGGIFEERMIPVRIMATMEQMKKIAVMTKSYYEQEAVMYYRISDVVIIE